MVDTTSPQISPHCNRWGTIQDAAEYFTVSVDTIRRMISRGEIEAKRFGPKLIRVNLESIEAAARPIIGGAQ